MDLDIAIVPIQKIKDYYSKSLTCEDFRAIAISPILSIVFEHCIVKRYDLRIFPTEY